jgi:pantoate--beta-alanine ligase
VRTLQRLEEVRAACRQAGASGTLGLVPTMGGIHEGHLSLVRRARGECDVVATTIFVNRLQFDEAADYERYPRDAEHDAGLLAGAGNDLLLLLEHGEMYPPGFATRVVQDPALTDRLEGAARPGHFTGVLTVVAKLLGLVRPARAYFGRKDFQQSVLVRRMVADLDLDTAIVVCQTVREPDGLALSSRNVFLSPDERRRGQSLVQALVAAEQRFEAGERSGPALEAAARAVLEAGLGGPPDYLALVDPERLDPRETARVGDVLVLAGRLGATRLIDNHVLGDRLGPFPSNS